MIARRPSRGRVFSHLSKQRRHRARLGRWAEGVAALYLQLFGYTVLERNFRTPVGEIDLIMRRGSHLVFVEVKYRRQANEPLIHARQWHRIARAAQIYVARHPELTSLLWRFDAVEFTPFLRHVRDAWRIYDCASERNG